MMNERNIEMKEINDEVLEYITGGKGYFRTCSKLIKKRSLVNVIYWLLFDEKTKKKKVNPINLDDLEYYNNPENFDDL